MSGSCYSFLHNKTLGWGAMFVGPSASFCIIRFLGEGVESLFEIALKKVFLIHKNYSKQKKVLVKKHFFDYIIFKKSKMIQN